MTSSLALIGHVFVETDGEAFESRSNEYGMQLTIRQAKDREPRILPVSPECAASIDAWLKIRNRTENRKRLV